jgi:hypothetical protein
MISRTLATATATCALLFTAMCSSSSTSPGSPALADSGASDADASPAPPTPGADTVVTPFDKRAVHFTGTDNQRTVDGDATFPADGAYQKIVLHLSLDCPQGSCDYWDRFGTLGIVTSKGVDGGADTVIELARFITPYRVAAKWDLDITDLRPLLSGALKLRAFIDTWVGPGSTSGNGWLLTARFEMTGGIPDKEPIAALPIWTQRSAAYGDPARPVASAFAPQTIALPSGASSFAVRTFITGHGQGNAANCAEFCSRKHTLTAAGHSHAQAIWRTDCATTATPNQAGTYTYPRAGWCPGADVRPWTVDVTPDVADRASATFAYDVEAYENSCRPDAVPDGGTCAACTLGTGCAYDGGSHTEPSYMVSSLLIAYR